MRATVLIVDDEAPLLRAMQRLLGKSFEVVPAGCIAAALAAFADHGDQVSAVLTDFSMPDGDGLQLTRALRERGYKGPIAILSAVVESDELKQALATGELDELIGKPWRSSELVDRVRVLCDRASPVGVDPAGPLRPVAA